MGLDRPEPRPGDDAFFVVTNADIWRELRALRADVDALKGQGISAGAVQRYRRWLVGTAVATIAAFSTLLYTAIQLDTALHALHALGH